MQFVLNAGSSSLKWALFGSEFADDALLRGQFERLGTDRCKLIIGSETTDVGSQDIRSALALLISELTKRRICTPEEITSIVHRVVHGGEKYHAPVVVDASVIADIDKLSVLAPLHNPANLAGIHACQDTFSQAVNIVVFDTSFHHTIHKEVFLYGIPYELYEKHRIRKYGFHGISHSFISSEVARRVGHPPNLISCHLGAGSSITAIKGGESMDTTMGFTPLDGLLMATRSGELDPEIPIFLLRQEHYTVDELDQLLSKQSGLLGLTGHSDLRDVYQDAVNGSERAHLALEMLCYRIAYYINALRTAVDPEAVVFTAGIGEGAWYVRERVCEYLGIELDLQANHANEEVVSVPGSDITVYVLHTNEEVQMHRLAQSLLQDNRFKR